MTSLSRLAVAAIVGSIAVLPALAETSKGSVQVSVTVTRSCRVETGGGQVAVGCGSGSHAVQVTQDGRTTAQTLSGTTPVAPSSASTVTVEF